MNESTIRPIFENWKKDVLKRNRKVLSELMEKYWYEYLKGDRSNRNLFSEFMKENNKK